MDKRIVHILSIFLIIVGCKAKQYDISQPPKGYSSNTTLKIAYATGALKLIETSYPLPESIKEYKDVVYKTADTLSLKLDVYHYKDIKENAPLLIFVHGGAWKKGKKEDYWHYLISYAKKGYVTATVQYRLSGVAKYPAQLNDVEDAIIWLKQHANDYHINNKQIALIGGSAGAHLSMMTAFTNTGASETKSENSPKVQALVNIYGPSDLTTEKAKNEGSVKFLFGKTFEEAPELYRRASPLFLVSKDAPPTLTFHGTLDELVPVAQSDRLHKKLQEVGVPSYYHKLKGWPHTMDIAVKVNEYCQYYMDDFFEKYVPLVNSLTNK
ncbi:alpha/beta hydrolase [Arenibacter sp. F26102]|uniref:alpha/beta hydrolase n=1 Tax=Arenibacter sp. F26102 TaxID=2926416 RepID=UPI001FF1E9AE|nr:alpha/beta hydrolase [Arenibacter sp. F26102]MCK0144817.1 alpha/beta hydrolase [Arenibacter sp. F26102]